jgi:hypothetical protein
MTDDRAERAALAARRAINDFERGFPPREGSLVYLNAYAEVALLRAGTPEGET